MPERGRERRRRRPRRRRRQRVERNARLMRRIEMGKGGGDSFCGKSGATFALHCWRKKAVGGWVVSLFSAAVSGRVICLPGENYPVKKRRRWRRMRTNNKLLHWPIHSFSPPFLSNGRLLVFVLGLNRRGWNERKPTATGGERELEGKTS